MPASIRIIKIVKDKYGPSGEEREAFTAEFECEAENAKDLAKELAASPYGNDIAEMLKRAEFIPEAREETIEEAKIREAEEEKERLEHEEKLKEEGREEIRREVVKVREKYLEYIRSKRPNAKTDEEKASEESANANTANQADTQSDHERDENAIVRIGPRGFMPSGDE